MSQPFRFDLDRTIQAVACLLRREPGRSMNYMRLLKVLYICERESLRDAGKPIVGSAVIAMKRGPVLEDVFKLVRSQHIGTPRWSEFFSLQNYTISMRVDPGIGKISPFVADKLEEVAQRHERDDEWAMVEFTHTLPEWIKNDPLDSCKPIPLDDILEAVGKSAELPAIIENAKRDAAAAKFFDSKPSHR